MIPLPVTVNKANELPSLQSKNKGRETQPSVSSVVNRLMYNRDFRNANATNQSALNSSFFDSSIRRGTNLPMAYSSNTLGLTSEYIDANFESRLRAYQNDYSKLMQIKQHKTKCHNSRAHQPFVPISTIPLMSIDTNIPTGSNKQCSSVAYAIEELQSIVKNLQEQVEAHIQNTNESETGKKDQSIDFDEEECIETLQYIYFESVKCSDHTLLRSLIILLMTSLIKHMMLASPDFAELYGDIDLSFEGISRKAKRNEFRLRLILKLKEEKLEIVDVGKKQPYLGRIRKVERILPTGVDSKIYYVWHKDGYVYLSSQKIYNLLQSAVDKALENVSNYIEIDKHKYKVVRSVSKILSLEIDTANIIDKSVDTSKSPIIRTEVDIFPEIKLDFTSLPIDFNPPLGEVRDRMMFLRRKLNSDGLGNFSAVAHISAGEKNKFSLRFYESVEKAILNGKGSMNIIMQIIEHIRVRHFPVFNVELLRICMMWNVLEKRDIDNYWDMKKIEACFINSLNDILLRMDSGWVPDPIFISNNLLPILLQKHGLSEEHFVPHALHYKDMDQEKIQQGELIRDETLKNLTSRGLAVLKDVNIWEKEWIVEKQDVRQLRGLISARRWLRTRLERYYKNQNIRVFFL